MAVERKTLAEHNPSLVDEWCAEKNDGLMPCDVSYGSNKQIWWACTTCGFQWKTSVKSRAKGVGCPACRRKRLSEENHERQFHPGINDLMTVNPSIAQEWNYEKIIH